MEVFKTQKLGESGAALKIGQVWIDSESEGVIELGEGPEIEEAVEHFIEKGFLSFDEPEPPVVEEVVEEDEEVAAGDNGEAESEDIAGAEEEAGAEVSEPDAVEEPVAEEAPNPKKKRGRKKKKSTGSK